MAGTDASASGSRPRLHADLPSGSKVGRYRLERILGAGAMGVVYLADDLALNRRVALKMLRRQDEQASERLMREAQALARVSHPNVIVVYEVGAFDDQIFMAMEYVQGESLSSWLQSARSEAEILAVFEQAGRGLSVAHGAGLVHRDFKPDNVLVGRDGRVRVVDFGLARGDVLLAESEGEGTVDRGLTNDVFRTLTRTGSFMGTPAYMAPEQYDGIAADARSDQFAFCVSLYEALYKKRPFAAGTVTELAQAMKVGPPPAQRSSRVSRRVEDVVLRGLRARREERFPSMDALLSELVSTAPPRGAKRARLLAWTAPLVAVLAGAWSYFGHPYRPSSESLPSQRSLEVAPLSVVESSGKGEVPPSPVHALAAPSSPVPPSEVGSSAARTSAVPSADTATAFSIPASRTTPRAARTTVTKAIAPVVPALPAGPLMPTTP